MHWTHIVNVLVYAVSGFLVALTIIRNLPKKEGQERSASVTYGSAVAAAVVMAALYVFVTWRGYGVAAPPGSDVTIPVEGTVAAAAKSLGAPDSAPTTS